MNERVGAWGDARFRLLLVPIQSWIAMLATVEMLSLANVLREFEHLFHGTLGEWKERTCLLSWKWRAHDHSIPHIHDQELQAVGEKNPNVSRMIFRVREQLICFKDSLCIPKDLQKLIVDWYHTYLMHPGKTCMEETIAQHLYWPIIRNTVTKKLGCFLEKIEIWPTASKWSNVRRSATTEELCWSNQNVPN